MNKQEFSKIYEKLPYYLRSQIDDKIEEIENLKKSQSDLGEKISYLSSKELDDLYDEEKEFIRQSEEEEKEILRACFLGSDNEESEENQNMALIDHKQYVNEIITSQYPSGIEILDNKISDAKRDLLSLIPSL